jgi:hypothetical protein
LIDLYGDKYNRHYYGFDTFGGYPEEDIKSTSNIDPEAWQGLHIESVRQTIQQCEAAETTTLIEGDLKQTLPEFIDAYSDSEKTPGNLNVALVYIDCNSYNATKAGLEALHKYISPGGIICADELKQGGETRALKEFCEENGLPFKRGKSPISWAPYTKIE